MTLTDKQQEIFDRDIHSFFLALRSLLPDEQLAVLEKLYAPDWPKQPAAPLVSLFEAALADKVKRQPALNFIFAVMQHECPQNPPKAQQAFRYQGEQRAGEVNWLDVTDGKTIHTSRIGLLNLLPYGHTVTAADVRHYLQQQIKPRYQQLLIEKYHQLVGAYNQLIQDAKEHWQRELADIESVLTNWVMHPAFAIQRQITVSTLKRLMGLIDSQVELVQQTKDRSDLKPEVNSLTAQLLDLHHEVSGVLLCCGLLHIKRLANAETDITNHNVTSMAEIADVLASSKQRLIDLSKSNATAAAANWFDFSIHLVGNQFELFAAELHQIIAVLPSPKNTKPHAENDHIESLGSAVESVGLAIQTFDIEHHFQVQSKAEAARELFQQALDAVGAGLDTLHQRQFNQLTARQFELETKLKQPNVAKDKFWQEQHGGAAGSGAARKDGKDPDPDSACAYQADM